MTSSRRPARGSRGQATIETVAYLPLLFAIFFTVVEVFAYFMTMEQVDNAARTGARMESQGYNGTVAARRALPASVVKQGAVIAVRSDGETATATVTGQVPIIFNGPIDWKVTRTVHMPVG